LIVSFSGVLGSLESELASYPIIFRSTLTINQPPNFPNFDPNKNNKKEGNWWNRSLGSAIENITSKLGKEPVPETVLALRQLN
jgi:hypothetical protein